MAQSDQGAANCAEVKCQEFTRLHCAELIFADRRLTASRRQPVSGGSFGGPFRDGQIRRAFQSGVAVRVVNRAGFSLIDLNWFFDKRSL